MNDELTLESILPKDAADLSEGERTHLNEHKSQLTQEQKEKFASVLEGEDNPGDEKAADDQENGDKTNE